MSSEAEQLADLRWRLERMKQGRDRWRTEALRLRKAIATAKRTLSAAMPGRRR